MLAKNSNLCPPLFRSLTRRRLKARHLRKMSPHEVFSKIHSLNSWKGTVSASGLGSDLVQTQHIIRLLPALLQRLDAASVLDIPCGDFYWMRTVDLGNIRYLGGDIVSALVQQNKIHETNNRTFFDCDLLSSDLPDVDVIFTRDCLVHFADDHVWAALANVARSSARYLITTTFTDRINEAPITTGQWRPLNLEAAPFRLPRPLECIREKCTQDNGMYADKSLGVWKVETIRNVLALRAA